MSVEGERSHYNLGGGIFRFGGLVKYFGSCWGRGTGEDPTQPLTLIVTLNPEPQPTLAVKAACAAFALNQGISQIADDDSEVQTALRKQCDGNTPKYPNSRIAKPTRGGRNAAAFVSFLKERWYWERSSGGCRCRASHGSYVQSA